MWLLYVSLYIIFSITFTQFYKIITKTTKGHGELTILVQLISGLFVLIFIPLFKMTWPSTYLTYIFIIIACVFYSIADRVNTTVRSGLEASTFSIVNQLTTVFMILFGLIFLKEPLILKKIIGALIIIFSNMLIFYKKGKFTINKYLILAMIANISQSIALFIDVNLSSNFNLPIYISIELIVPAIFIFLIEKIKFKNVINEFKTGNKLGIVITSISFSSLILFLLLAYQNGKVTTIAPLCALTVIMNVIVGYIFLKERDNLLKKIIAAILIIISVILIKV